jgi:hypothetical protein
VAAASVWCAVACATTPDRQEAPLRGFSEPLEFLLGMPNGQTLSARALRQRVTVLVFGTTFDLASQEQARIVEELLHRHRPRLNAALIALEPPNHAVLVDAFRKSLNLSYPVAMAEPSERESFSPALGLERVPVIVVLDREGRIAVRREGLVSLQELEALAARVER